MDCLRYLLTLLEQGHKFVILYDSNHCCGINETKIFDLNNQFKKDILKGDGFRYLPIEKCHKKEIIIRIFNLDERCAKVINEYYDNIYR